MPFEDEDKRVAKPCPSSPDGLHGESYIVEHENGDKVLACGYCHLPLGSNFRRRE